MKAVLLCLAIWMLVLSISAGTAWDAPVNVVKYGNITYYGAAATAANGNSLLAWAENIDGSQMLCLQVYSANLQPVMPQPLVIESSSVSRCKAICTPAGDFIFTVPRADGLYAFKLSNTGIPLWGTYGVQLFSWYSGYPGIFPDFSGGAWFSQWGDLVQYRGVQHVDTNGNRLLPLNGISPEPDGVTMYQCQLYGMWDDGAIVVYSDDTTLKAKRYSANGEIVWENATLASGLIRTYRICSFGDTYYAISWWTDGGLWMQRYNWSGDALWDAPLCVITGYGDLPSRTLQIPASDGNVFVTYQIWGEPIKLQKVSPSGELLFGPGTVLSTYTTLLSADSLGGCYAATGYNDVKAFRISSFGQHLWGPDGLPVCVDSIKQEYLHIGYSAGALRMFWMDWREAYPGIYSQKALPSGELQYTGNGVGIHTGSYAEICNLRVHAMQDRSVLVWAQKPQGDGMWQLRMQIVLPDGTSQLAPGGVPITDYCLMSSNPFRQGLIVTPNQQIMVSWFDSITYQCKAQLFSDSGVPLWDTPSITVNGTTNSSTVSWLDGGFVFVWRDQLPSGANRLFGQRIVNGVNQWPAEGLQLVGDDPLNPYFSVGIWGLSGDYLIWERGQIWCLRFTSDGSPATGFPAWGLQVSNTQSPYNRGSFSFRALGENLHVSWYENYLLMPSFDYYCYHFCQQVLAPDGSFLIAPPGVIYADEGDALLDFSFDAGVGEGCFIDGFSSHIAYRLRIHSQTGDLINEWDCDVYDPPRWFDKISYIRGLESGKIMLLGQYYTANTYLYSYLVANPDEPAENPPVTVIFEQPTGFIKGVELSPEGESFHLAAAVACSQNAAASSIYLQKIIDPGSPASDPEVQSPALISLSLPRPNPFVDSVEFDCALPRDSYTRISIYNLRGQRVRTLHNGNLPKGTTRFVWDGKDDTSRTVSAGIYFLRAQSGGTQHTQKLLKLH